MALEIDSKLMKVADEFADFDLLKPKSQPGPEFQTQEIDSMFILTVQLKGYRRTNINVERTEDGRRIIIKEEKPFQDMLKVGGKVVKKDVEMRGFQKSFKVPQGVVSDQIKVSFNEDDSKLIIRMPKVTKGLMGVNIEEMKIEEIQTKSTKPIHVYSNAELSEQENLKVENENIQDVTINILEDLEEHKPQLEDSIQSNELHKEELSPDSKESDNEEPKSPRKRFKICKPVIFGSAFLMSLIVLVFHLVQSKKPASEQKKKDED